MSILGKVSTMILTAGIVGSGSFYVANANVVNFTAGSKTSGSVTLDDNDKVIEASSPEFYQLVTNTSDKVTNTSNKVTNTSNKNSKLKYKVTKLANSPVNYANSRWVFYSDNHNLFTGYKEGHSNYIHYSQYHSSYATVGGRGDGWRSNSAGKYSYSNASGTGTFVAKIDAPYY